MPVALHSGLCPFRPVGAAGAIVCVMLGHFPAMADGHEWYVGEWCGPDGRYAIDRDGIFAGDHVLCAWMGDPPAGRSVDARLRCEAVYSDGAVRMDAGTLCVEGDAANDDRLTLTFDGSGNSGRHNYTRCD